MPKSHSRVIVTGSRKWTDKGAVRRALEKAQVEMPSNLLVVHGDCPTGADRIVDELCHKKDIPVERHPAVWSVGKKAGPLRNRYMVSLGADLCIAFLTEDSIGTRGCITMAQGAGIETWIIEE